MMGVYLIVLCLISIEMTHADGVSAENSTAVADVNVPSSTPSMRRLVTVGNNAPIDRDNKLMSVLAARRHALIRDRGRSNQKQDSNATGPLNKRSECEKNCTSNFTARASAGCMRKCAVLYKVVLNNKSIDNLNSRIKIEEKDANTLADELLETEESQSNGLYYVHPRNRYAPNVRTTKDQNNTNNLKNNYKNNVIENEVRQTSTEKLNSMISRTIIEGRHKRVDSIKLRQRLPAATEKSVEESDLLPYLFFGKKLSVTAKFNESKNLVTQNPRNKLDASTPAKPTSKLNEEELVDASNTKQSSFDRNKIRRFNPQTRNIVAFHRKVSGIGSRAGGLNSNPVVNTSSVNSLESRTGGLNANPVINISSADSLKIRAGGLNSNPVVNISSIDSLNFMPNSTFEVPQQKHNKILNLTDIDRNNTTANFTNAEEVITEVNLVASTEVDVNKINRNSSNILNNLNETELYAEILEQSDLSDPIHIDLLHTEPIPFIIDSEKESVNLKEQPTKPTVHAVTQKINYEIHHLEETPNLILFLPPNITLTDQTTAVQSTLKEQVENMNKTTEVENIQGKNDSISSTLKSFTRTTVSSSIRSTINSINNSSYKPFQIAPTAPVFVETTTKADDIKTSSVLSVKPTEFQLVTSTNTSITTTEIYTNKTIFNLSSIFPNFSGVGSNIPVFPDLAAIFSPANTTKKPQIMIDGVLLSRNNDVTIEMHRMNMATYVLAGLGMFPIVVIILYVGKSVLFRKRTKTSGDLERYIKDGDKPISPVVRLDKSDQSSYTEDSIMTDQSFNRNFLKFKNLLGEGNFGQVWKAEADDLAGHLGTTRIVAVKTERCGNINGGLKEEGEIMRKLGSHANVVTLLGACLEKEPHLLIMEFAMRGRLLSLLRAAKSASNNLPSANVGVRNLAPLSPRRLAGFAHDIARGMEYISEKKIVHRDLAARNVLLDHNGVCKICDFGMSIDLEKSNQQSQHRKADLLRQQSSPESPRFKFDFHRRSFNNERKSENCKRPALPIRWMAPEALQYHIFSTETDVWAFGIVLWEIASLGCTPYPTLSGREVVRNVPNGTRPDVPIDCRPELYELMSRTWQKDPRQRPTFSEARTELARSLCQWEIEDTSSDYLDVSGFSEDLEHGMVYFNRRISEFECEI